MIEKIVESQKMSSFDEHTCAITHKTHKRGLVTHNMKISITNIKVCKMHSTALIAGVHFLETPGAVISIFSSSGKQSLELMELIKIFLSTDPKFNNAKINIDTKKELCVTFGVDDIRLISREYWDGRARFVSGTHYEIEHKNSVIPYVSPLNNHKTTLKFDDITRTIEHHNRLPRWKKQLTSDAEFRRCRFKGCRSCDLFAAVYTIATYQFQRLEVK